MTLKIADELSILLADTYGLYIKTHNFHWNVTGPMFNSLHVMFETQYTELQLAVDEIAERIRALNVFAPSGFSVYLKLSSIKEETGVPKADAMIQQLIDAHHVCIDTAKKAFKQAETGNDQPSMDLLTRRIELHEKTTWMLKSQLG